MGKLKRTYTLPADPLVEFEQAISPGRRSAVIAQVLREWLEKQRRQQLRREVIEGCQEMRGVYLGIEQEYHPLEEEVSRALDNQPQNAARSCGFGSIPSKGLSRQGNGPLWSFRRI